MATGRLRNYSVARLRRLLMIAVELMDGLSRDEDTKSRP